MTRFMLTLWSAIALVGLVAILGCRRPIPPPPPVVDSGVMNCSALSQEPAPEDVCEGRTTPAGLQCVKCKVPVACFHAAAGIYCTPECFDPTCNLPGRHR